MKPILSVALIIASTGCLLAVDGVVLIDQNRALSGSVTPGDTPGFPVTISTPGSYRLSSNLTTTSGIAIFITGAGVTLDLNGFMIEGGGTCREGTQGELQLACTSSSTHGVRISAGQALVRNGVVNGFGVGLLSESLDASLEDIRASRNAVGIQAAGGRVRRCSLSNNNYGVWSYNRLGVRVTDSLFAENGTGIRFDFEGGSYQGNNFHNHLLLNLQGSPINLGQNVCDNRLCP